MKQGATLAGRFVIEGLSRSGAMAAVFKARDLLTDKPVALKVLFGDVGDQVARFEREAMVLSELDHPAIVKYVAHGQTPDGGRYMAMEWLRGEDLQRHLARADMTVGESTRLIARVAEGLALCHAAGIVHRDIKPANLFLRDGKTSKVKLIDFGIALLSQEGTLRTDPEITLGTPGYMSPEQAQSGMPVDHRADIFALGSVLFRCLSGRRAFVGDSPMAIMAKTIFEEAPRVSQFRNNVPSALDDLVARMLANDPADRPHSAREVAETLHAMSSARVSGRMRKQDKHALTSGERRLLSVVLARLPRSKANTSKNRLPSQAQFEISELSSAVETFGARLTEMPGGFVIVTLEGMGTATDQAARAAMCALAVREVVGENPVALATGSGELSQRPVGEVIERAVALVRTEEEFEYVRIDNITAGLLNARFDIAPGNVGLTLRGERPSIEQTRTLLGRPTPCVGRTRELGYLGAIFDETASDSVANTVLITGPPGIGKSRLRSEFLLQVQSKKQSVEIWQGRGDPMSAGSPYGLLAPAIRHATGIVEADNNDARRAKLVDRVFRYIDNKDVQRVSTFLAELIGLRDEEHETAQLKAARLDPVLMNDQMRRAWLDFLGAELVHHPVVIVAEDLQWGDRPSLGFIEEALRAYEDRPLLVVAVARPEYQESFPNLWPQQKMIRFELKELSEKASSTLVREVLGADISPERVEALVKQAAGNPFFLEELIRSAAENNDASGDLPKTVLAMAQARIENLHADSRRVLRAAAIFGRSFTPSALEQLLGGPNEAPNVGVRMAELTQDEVIERLPEPKQEKHRLRIYESHYSFRHDLVRQAAYNMLTEEDRILGHRMAAEWLEKNEEIEPLALADHFEKGGQPVRAVKYFVASTEQALDGNDVVAALNRAERGANCGAKGEELGGLRLMQAEACRWTGQYADSENYGREAMRLIRRGSASWYQAAGLLATAASNVGNWDTLVSVGDDLSAMSPADAAIGQHMIALARSADGLLFVGRYDQADALLGRIEGSNWHPSAQEPEVQAWVHRVRANRNLFSGAPARFLDEIERAALFFEECEQLRNALLQRGALGYGFLHVGLYHQARSILESVLAQALELSLTNVVTAVQSDLGTTLGRLGALGEARELLERAAEACIEQKNPQLEGTTRVQLAQVLELMGSLQEAEDEARRSIELLDIFLPSRTTALATGAKILLRRGELEEAEQMAEDACELLESLGGIADGEATVPLVHAEALLAMDKREAATEILAQARDRVIERAELIEDEKLRSNFINNVPANARTLELSSQLGC